MSSATYFYDLYKEMYLAEDDRKDSIHARLPLPAGAITVLAGVEAYYARNAPLSQGWSSAILLVCAVALLAGIIAATCFLFRSLHNHVYAYTSAANVIEQYRTGLMAHYEAVGAGNACAQAEEEVRDLLASQYIECHEINAKINITRFKYLHRTHSAIIFSLIVLLVSLVPFYLVYKATPQIQRIEVVNFSKGDVNNASGTSRSVPTNHSDESAAEHTAAGTTTETSPTPNPDDQRGH